MYVIRIMLYVSCAPGRQKLEQGAVPGAMPGAMPGAVLTPGAQIGTNGTVTNGAVNFAQTCVTFAKTISQICANLRKFGANPANFAQIRPNLHVATFF